MHLFVIVSWWTSRVLWISRTYVLGALQALEIARPHDVYSIWSIRTMHRGFLALAPPLVAIM
jgi:hypothetical protein